jgi:hypothetical protein
MLREPELSTTSRTITRAPAVSPPTPCTGAAGFRLRQLRRRLNPTQRTLRLTSPHRPSGNTQSCTVQRCIAVATPPAPLVFTTQLSTSHRIIAATSTTRETTQPSLPLHTPQSRTSKSPRSHLSQRALRVADASDTDFHTPDTLLRIRMLLQPNPSACCALPVAIGSIKS